MTRGSPAMDDDVLLRQFTEQPIPAPPTELVRGVRSRVNTSLVGLQLADFVLGAIPAAIAAFAPAVLDVARQTAVLPKDDARRRQ